jgi:3-oxoacyl-[acyl-carrier protein] reductase
MDLGLKDKHAVVMGATSGIGFAIAKCLLAEGARVTVGGRDPKKIEGAIAELGSRASGLLVDLAEEKSIREAMAKLLAGSSIDILVNNTGGPAAGNPLEISLEDWDRGYRTLVRSVILLAQLVVPSMKSRRWGRILTVTSTSARELIPKLPVSSTFRAGLSAWAKELAKDAGRSGILVNNLLPGPTRTGRITELEKKSPEFYHAMEAGSALGRIAEPEEIGRVAAFLVSGANTFITGTDVLVDGGYTKAL